MVTVVTVTVLCRERMASFHRVPIPKQLFVCTRIEMLFNLVNLFRLFGFQLIDGTCDRVQPQVGGVALVEEVTAE